MQGRNNPGRWLKVRNKQRNHWGILTLDDLPKTKGEYSRLIAQLQARYRAAKELGTDKPNQKIEDISL